MADDVSITLSGLEIGDVYYFVNGASYGPYLEYGTQYIRPLAFVRGAIGQAELIADRAARRVADGIDRASTPYDFME